MVALRSYMEILKMSFCLSVTGSCLLRAGSGSVHHYFLKGIEKQKQKQREAGIII
jgi:hypothetical protein